MLIQSVSGGSSYSIKIPTLKPSALSNCTDLRKACAKLSCVGFRTCGYEIKNDMAAWQLAIVTGQGISPSSSIGTSTFYTAAKGDKSVVIDQGPAKSVSDERGS